MKDRNVQYPNRYRDKVSGNVIDLEPMPGTVTEEGTPLNKATLLSDRTAEGLSLSGDTATVNMALRRTNLSSFMTFCGANLDAALGKGNESRLFGIGRQLAMYAWFMGETAAFPTLVKCDSLKECYQYAIAEIFGSPSISALLDTSAYALDNLYLADNITTWKRSYEIMSKLVTVPAVVDKIRENHWATWKAGWQTYTARGSVSFTVPAGVTCLTVEVVGAGADGMLHTRISTTTQNGGSGGQYRLAVLRVEPGQVITGSISDTGTAFGGVSLGKGGGAKGTGSGYAAYSFERIGSSPTQTGKFLKVSAGGRAHPTGNTAGGGGGGYGGGNGGTGGGRSFTSTSRPSGGVGSNVLPITAGTGGTVGGDYGSSPSYSRCEPGTGGGGGGGGSGRAYANSDSTDICGGGGGGGYGGGGGGAIWTDHYENTAGVAGGKGGSGCIVIYM